MNSTIAGAGGLIRLMIFGCLAIVLGEKITGGSGWEVVDLHALKGKK